MEEIFSLSAEELYNKALIFRNTQDYDNYAMYMTMSANLDYELAKNDIADDYNGARLFENQNNSKTLKFYEATCEKSYSLNYLGYLYSQISGIGWWNTKSVEYYEKAIEKGNCHAYVNLAHIYKNGSDGITQSFLRAKELFEKSIQIRVMEYAVDGLIDVYIYSDLKNDKDNVIKYFVKIGHENKLKEIYDYTDEHIAILKKNIELSEQNERLIKENEELKIHIMAQPDGELFFKAKESWNNLK